MPVITMALKIGKRETKSVRIVHLIGFAQAASESESIAGFGFEVERKPQVRNAGCF